MGRKLHFSTYRGLEIMLKRHRWIFICHVILSNEANSSHLKSSSLFTALYKWTSLHYITQKLKPHAENSHTKHYVYITQSINQSVKTYIAPLQDTYSEALPNQSKRKRTVLRRWWNWEQAPFWRCLRSTGRSFQVVGPTTENEGVCIVAEQANGTTKLPRDYHNWCVSITSFNSWATYFEAGQNVVCWVN